MTGRCLGARVADLADGRLSPSEADRAYAHVAGCSACAAALHAQRAISGGLRAVSGQAAPTDDLVARLMRISEIPAPPVDGVEAAIPVQGASETRLVGRPMHRARTGSGTPTTASAPSSTQPRRRTIVVGAAAGVAAVAMAALLGGSAALSAQVTVPTAPLAPVVDTLAAVHVTSTDRLPLTGPQFQTVADSGTGTAADSSTSSPAP